MAGSHNSLSLSWIWGWIETPSKFCASRKQLIIVNHYVKLQKFFACSSEALMIGCLSILRVDMYWTWYLLSRKPPTKWKPWAQTLSVFYFFLQCFINCLTHMAILLVARLHSRRSWAFEVFLKSATLSHFSLYLSLRETERNRYTCMLARVYIHTEGE